MEPDSIKLLISTPMRVGSTWIGQVCNHILGLSGCHYLDKSFIKKGEKLDKEELLVINNTINYKRNVWFKSHLLLPEGCISLSRVNSRLRAINILRNKEDALLSRFYYAVYHSPFKGAETDASKVLMDRGLDDDIDKIRFLTNETNILKNWSKDIDRFNIEINSPQILTLIYEKLRNWDDAEFARLFCFLGGYESKKELQKRFGFEKMAQKERGIDEKSRFVRKAEVGSGKEIFTEEIMNIIDDY